MTEHYTIPLPPVTKKNSSQIIFTGQKCPVCKRGKNVRLLPSKKYREYEEAALWRGNGGGRNMKCKDCVCYKNNWCTMVTDSPDPDMERDCGHFIRAQRWVPVTERLPEPMEWVLAIMRGRRKYQVVRFDNINEGFTKPHVTHWIPLPEPPEVSE